MSFLHVICCCFRDCLQLGLGDGQEGSCKAPATVIHCSRKQRVNTAALRVGRFKAHGEIFAFLSMIKINDCKDYSEHRGNWIVKCLTMYCIEEMFLSYHHSCAIDFTVNGLSKGNRQKEKKRNRQLWVRNGEIRQHSVWHLLQKFIQTALDHNKLYFLLSAFYRV